MLHDAVRRAGFASASIWAPVPALRRDAAEPEGDARAPRQARASCSTSASISPTSTSRRAAWERSVAEVVAGDADVSVRTSNGSKSRYDAAGVDRLVVDDDDDDEDDEDDEDWFDEDDLPSGESLAEDFERYLREQRDD